MNTNYQPATMLMIYDMVQNEKKTIPEIADYLCAYAERIESIYQAAVVYYATVVNPPCTPVHLPNILPLKVKIA